MTKKTELTIFILIVALCIACALLTAFLMKSWGVIVRVVFFCAFGAGLAVNIISFIFKKHTLLKSAFILLILAAIVLVAFIIMSEVAGFNSDQTDAEKIEALIAMIEDTGGWGMLAFFVLQILQIVVLPLPAVVCYVPGVKIWGSLIATLLASAGVIAGSLIAYFIGKVWGRKAVVWIAGSEVCDKYTAYFGKKGKTLFVLMQILPFFPDDILCMIAGLTKMNFPFFLVTMVIVRPLIIAAYCYGTQIPFSGWGIWVWISIFAVCIVLAVLSWKYQDKFENWLVSKFRKNKCENTVDKDEDE